MHEGEAIRDQRGGDTDSMYAAGQAIQAAGLEATVPRLAVWRVIADSDRPLGAVEIKRRLARGDFNIAMSSIYLSLKRLAAAGLFSTCNVAGKAHYYLSSRHFHQRFICKDSGDEYWLSDPDLGRAVEAFCRKHGFALSDYTLSVQGRLTGDMSATRG